MNSYKHFSKSHPRQKSLSILSLAFLFLWMVACSHGNCRNQAEAQKNLNGELSATQLKEIEKMKETSQGQRVKVYKFDGSLQCGQGHKIPLDEMKKELGDIRVYNQFNKNDGKMRIQVCGSPTGQCNVFEIDRESLDKALKMGFKEWTQD